MGTGVPGIDSVIFKQGGFSQHQRRTPFHLRPERTGHILAGFHGTAGSRLSARSVLLSPWLRGLHRRPAPLVIQAQDGRHTVSAGRPFQGRGNFFAVADTAGRGARARRKSGGQDTGIPLTGLTAAAAQCGVFLRREKTAAIPFRRNTRNKGLLFHPRLCGKGGGHIVQIPHLVPLVGGKGGYSFYCFSRSPACSSSASFNCGGSALPRSSARRRIPRQAFLLK